MHGYLKICLDLFYLKGHTVSALTLSRICLMGTYRDCIQRAVISIRSDVSALQYGTVDFLITVVVHSFLPPKDCNGVQQIFCPAFIKI